MIKKILTAFLLGLLTIGSYAKTEKPVIKLDADRTIEVLRKYFPDEEQRIDAIDFIRKSCESNKSRFGFYGLTKEDFIDFCNFVGGWKINTLDGLQKCEGFTYSFKKSYNDEYYYPCSDINKGKSGGTEYCIDDVFYHWYTLSDAQVTMLQAEGLCEEYVRVNAQKYNNDEIECSSKPRQNGFNDFVACRSKTAPIYYEFKFDNVFASNDASIQNSIMESLCTIYDLKYHESIKTLDAYGNVQMTVPYCETKNANACKKISESGKRFNYYSEIRTGDFYGSGYCGFYQTNKIYSYRDLQTAYGIKNDVFYAGIQLQGSKNVKDIIKTYVANTIDPEPLKEFKCNDNAIQIGSIRGKSDNDDVLTCYVNGKRIDFVFDDLSEAWKTYDESGKEAMNCIAWGGTFSGKHCIGLDEKTCNKVRDANAQSCPECRMIKWNSEANICELPESVSATNLKRGLTYSAMIGGAVASVVITIGSMGAGGLTVGTVIVMVVETTGAAIELGEQINIDQKADNFFLDSAKCSSETCAKELVYKYLIELARMERDLDEAEIDAIDKEMARLIELIPTDSDWWIDSLKTEDGKSLLEQANDGGWTSAQVWRAIGIGMQFVGVASSITGWILKKAGYLEKTLDRTSRILLRSARVAKANMVKVDKLDDIGKEWYKLWQEYAPKNQTLEQFKAMTNGDLDKMKQMAKSWTPRSEKQIIIAQINKQKEEISKDLVKKRAIREDLMEKYDLDILPSDPDELAKLYKEHPDLEQAVKAADYAETQEEKMRAALYYYGQANYSTFDPEFSKTFNPPRVVDEGLERLRAQYDDYTKQIETLQGELDELEKSGLSSGVDVEKRKNELVNKIDDLNKKKVDIAITAAERPELGKPLEPSQWDIAEKYYLGNIDNVAEEHAVQLAEVVNANPEIKSMLNEKVWAKLSDQERADVAQKILNKYADKIGTPRVPVDLDYKMTEWGGMYHPLKQRISLNPTANMTTPDGVIEIIAHEYGHAIDDLAPNEGALGAQYDRNVAGFYSNERAKGYRVALTEQSSYKQGPAAADKVFTGSNSGKEHTLEAAKKAEQEAPEKLDNVVGGFGAGVPTAIGVNVGIWKTYIDSTKEKTKNKEEDYKTENNENKKSDH
jgi:predicted metal-dependent hydrolase